MLPCLTSPTPALQAELIVGDQSGAIHIWDLKTDHNEQLIPEPEVSITSTHIDPDASYMAAVNSTVSPAGSAAHLLCTGQFPRPPTPDSYLATRAQGLLVWLLTCWSPCLDYLFLRCLDPGLQEAMGGPALLSPAASPSLLDVPQFLPAILCALPRPVQFPFRSMHWPGTSLRKLHMSLWAGTASCSQLARLGP